MGTHVGRLAAPARRASFALLVAGALASTLNAQVRDTTRTKRDTLRGRGDTITFHRDSTAKRDTTRDVIVRVPAREDSLLRRDSLVRRDSLLRPPRDTVKAPIASTEAPVLADPTGSFVWDRRDLYSTGALTVADLLERVPGVTTIRSGWISQPMVGSFLGAPGRVRIFLDGLELEELDPRMRRAWDLTQIPIWALDDIRVERGASEVRVYMRSWRVDRTTPFTRTDVYTGDQATNLYRGYFGRRYPHGEVVQAAAQQFGTDPGRNATSSDQLGVLLRTGIARRRWSADVMLLRGDRNRGITLAVPLGDSIAAAQSTRTDVYGRVAIGHTDRGFWAQAIASGSKYAYGGKKGSGSGAAAAGVTDTTRFRSQYALSGGYASGPWRVSVTQRFRAGLYQRVATPSARASFDSRFVTIAAFGEGRGLDSTRRLDVSAVLRPLPFVFVAGAFGSEQPLFVADSTSRARFARAEAGVRVGGLWLSGGVLRRGPTALTGPRVVRKATVDTTSASLQGTFATVRGRIWKALYADAQAVQWSDTGSLYRPRYQTRSELYLSTSMLRRFPSGNFHLLASAVHEYRSSTLWPDSAGIIRLRGYRTISTLLQVRILSAELFWNLRNVLGERYAQIPGYQLPRLTNVYGVRWEFWN